MLYVQCRRTDFRRSPHFQLEVTFFSPAIGKNIKVGISPDAYASQAKLKLRLLYFRTTGASPQRSRSESVSRGISTRSFLAHGLQMAHEKWMRPLYGL